MLGDVVGTTFLLVEFKDVQVLDVVIQMVHEVVLVGSCRVAGREPSCRSKAYGQAFRCGKSFHHII